MHFLIERPAYPNETLDYYNYNLPFFTLGKNQDILDKYIDKIVDFSNSLEIFTEKDKIFIYSDGVSNRFFIDKIADIVNITGEMTLYASSVFKKSIVFDNITDNSILNMEELEYYMSRNGFLPRYFDFDSFTQKAKYPFSNLLSVRNIEQVLISRDILEPTLVSPVTDTPNDRPYDIVNIDFANTFLIPKQYQTDIVKVEHDNINRIEIDTGFIYSAVFVEDYEPTEGRQLIPKRYCTTHGYTVSPVISEETYINEPLLSRTPINKESLVDISSRYISTTDKHAKYFSVNRTNNIEIPEDFVISYNEAKSIIDKKFKDILSPRVEDLQTL
jgi:hypothetical protein